MRLLAIDPGYERLGLAILEKNKGSKEELVYSECFKTSAKLPHHKRLSLIGEKIREIVKKYKPTHSSIETLFLNTNQKTVMAVSEARGVILYECSCLGLEVFEYTPLQIKIAVTGYGRSDKKQIMEMIPRLITLSKDHKHQDDEYDAIAVGLTCFASEKFN